MAFIKLSWRPSPPSEKIAEYEIWQRHNGGEWKDKMCIPKDRSDVRFYLEEGGAYEFKMRAYSLHFGWSPFSRVVALPAPPTAPWLEEPTVEKGLG